MKRPSLQFYPADWRANAKLRRCSFAERGVWLEVMCLLHDSEDYGILRWPLKDIAVAVGCRVSDLRALRDKGVLKGADAGSRCDAYVYVPRHAREDGEPAEIIPAQDGSIWYSSRMVRDEYLRSKRGAGTRFGDTPKAAPIQREGDTPKAAPIQREGDGASSSSSSSRKTSPIAPFQNSEDAACFARWYASYPVKAAKGQAEKAWAKLRPDDCLTTRMIEAVGRQAENRRRLVDDGRFVPEWKHPATWLNAKAWEDETLPLESRASEEGNCSCGALGVVKVNGQWLCSEHREAA